MSKNLFATFLGLNATARSMGAPFQTAAALRADAEKEVDKIVARVEATSQAGGLRQLNRSYKAYRAQQIAKAERAQPYSKFLEERYTAKIVRSVAAVWCERLLSSLTNGLPSRSNVCTRRKRTCGPQGGSSGLDPSPTSTVFYACATPRA